MYALTIFRHDHLQVGARACFFGQHVRALAARGVTAFSTDAIPRITRAQAMDVLSSQSNLAGYRAVIEAAARSRAKGSGWSLSTSIWPRTVPPPIWDSRVSPASCNIA